MPLSKAVERRQNQQKLHALVQRALVSTTDAGVFVNHCRFNMGMNYNQTFDFLKEVHPKVELPEWDQLLAKVDEEASQ